MAQVQSNFNPDILEAQKSIAAGRFGDAVLVCREILAKDAHDLDAMNVMGIAYALSGEAMKSAEILAQAIIQAPDAMKYKTNFAKAVGMLNMQHATTEKVEQIRAAVAICLEDDRLEHKVFLHLWYGLVMMEPVFVRMMSGQGGLSFNEMREALSSRFLHLGLRRLIAAGGVPFEQMMSDLRRRFLLEDGYDAQDFLPFLCALAEQCNLNEYVYREGDDEREAIDALERELADVGAFDFSDVLLMSKIALLGAYRDLSRLAFAERVCEDVGEIGDDALRSMVDALIIEPRAVMDLRDEIHVLSDVTDGVSSSVRAQYEDNPYPRWRCVTAPSLTDEQRAKGRGKRILVAGCGTGKEILSMALHYPEAEVITGLDLSRASLAYGQGKAREVGVENVEFVQGDILELDRLEAQYDMIVCSGVLHHMRDPIAGWKKLIERLKPSGVMKIALYSRIARRNVIECQQWIVDQGYEATDAGISQFRQAVMAMDDDNPLKAMVEPIDFYSMSMCRDLLFHVQEHVYSLPQIGEMLGALDLDLIAFNMNQPGMAQKYRHENAHDTALRDVQALHAFEERNPDVFVGMYSFWCGRSVDVHGALPDWIFTDRV